MMRRVTLVAGVGFSRRGIGDHQLELGSVQRLDAAFLVDLIDRDLHAPGSARADLAEAPGQRIRRPDHDVGSLRMNDTGDRHGSRARRQAFKSIPTRDLHFVMVLVERA